MPPWERYLGEEYPSEEYPSEEYLSEEWDPGMTPIQPPPMTEPGTGWQGIAASRRTVAAIEAGRNQYLRRRPRPIAATDLVADPPDSSRRRGSASSRHRAPAPSTHRSWSPVEDDADDADDENMAAQSGRRRSRQPRDITPYYEYIPAEETPEPHDQYVARTTAAMHLLRRYPSPSSSQAVHNGSHP
jgi:hypothetical protein